MTQDFIDQAADILDEHGAPYLLIAAMGDNDPRCIYAARIHSIEQLEWFKRRFDDFYNRKKSEMTDEG